MPSLLQSTEMNGAPVVSDRDMPFVRFESKTLEDPGRTKREKKPCWKDVHFVFVTTPGSKDIQPEEVEEWWPKMEMLVESGRMPAHWLDKWKADYQRFKNGQEIPVDGTPIKGWSLIPGSIQELLISINVKTVEALAGMSDEAIGRVGMGAVEFKRRAQAWVKQHSEKDGPAIEIAALQQENDSLKASVKDLTEKIEALSAMVSEKKGKK